MAETANAEIKPAKPVKPTLAELVKAYQAMEDPKERAAFYWANPALAQVYSAVNHS